jgi:riboflavin kinase / FMN adenylyltransferase
MAAYGKSYYTVLMGQKYSAAIGIFDGFHNGHKKILKRLSRFKPNMVMTFRIHPRHVKTLIPFSERLRVLKCIGIGRIHVFTPKDKIIGLSAEEFIKDTLKKLKIKRVIIGSDFKLGHHRRTNAKHFKKMCAKYDIDVEIVHVLTEHGKKLSSSDIRKFLLNGKIEAANSLLGHSFYISGSVVKGKGVGGRLGFKTANIIPEKNQLTPMSGVYKTKTLLNGKTRKSFTYIGKSPTLKTKKPLTIETHIPGIRASLNGKKITVIFLKRLRGDIKFRSQKELIKAIARDVAL